MRLLTNQIVGVTFHAIGPMFLASLLGYGIGSLFGGRGYEIIFWISAVPLYAISINLFTQSFYQVRDNVWVLPFLFGECIADDIYKKDDVNEGKIPLSSGLSYVPGGFIKNSIQSYTKATILIQKVIIVDKLKKTENPKDRKDSIDYSMTINLLFNVYIENPWKFFKTTGLQNMLLTNISIKAMKSNKEDKNKNSDEVSALMMVIEDLASTVDTVAAGMGFDELKKRTDWSLEDLIRKAREYADSETLVNYDTLPENIERYGLEIGPITTYTELDEETARAQKELRIAEARKESKEMDALTAAIVSRIKAERDAENTKIQAEADKEKASLEGKGVSGKIKNILEQLMKDPSFKEMDAKSQMYYLATMMGKANIDIKKYDIEGFNADKLTEKAAELIEKIFTKK